MDICNCEECRKLEQYENKIKDQYFSYRKNLSHWIWHSDGHLLLYPFHKTEGDPVNYALITMSKWNWKDDGRIVKLTWFEEYKWNITLYINGEKKEEDIIIIPNDINETLDVNMFMNLCCHWMLIYPEA